jgi:hypothetical protein
MFMAVRSSKEGVVIWSEVPSSRVDYLLDCNFLDKVHQQSASGAFTTTAG